MHKAVLDQWQSALEEKKNALEVCQKEKGVQSCLKCDQLLHCKVREAYVKAVYESMNKGKSGGFEF